MRIHMKAAFYSSQWQALIIQDPYRLTLAQAAALFEDQLPDAKASLFYSVEEETFLNPDEPIACLSTVTDDHILMMPAIIAA